MLSSWWTLRVLPYAVVVALASAVVLNSSTSRQSPPVSGALSRHPLSQVYSDLPYRDPLPVLLLSLVVHSLLFRFCPLPAAWRPTATSSSPPLSSVVQRNYCVSTVHAVSAICSVVWWLSVHDVDWRSVQRGMGGGRRGTGDEWHSIAVCWSLGYFLYDTLCMCEYSATRSSGALVHHCAIGSAFLVGLYTDCCRPFHFLFLLEELSTPPLNLKSLCRQPAWLSDVCAALFAATFVCVRLGYGMCVYVLACMQLAPFVRQAAADGEKVQVAAALFQFVLCTASRALNLYWAALIARKVRRVRRRTAPNNRRPADSEESEKVSTTTHTADGGDKLD